MARDMLSEKDRETILKYARKYNLKTVILFGSSIRRVDTNDIDIAIKGIDPRRFFDFYWELYRDLSKPVDVIDLSRSCLFNKIIEEEGEVLYG